MSGFSLPAAPPQTPGFPANPHPLIFDGFDGLNTKPSRPGIEDQQFYWCENFMPLGKSNLRTLYDVGDPIYINVGSSISYFAFANVADTPYCLSFLADGSIVATNTTTLASNIIAAPGTITNPSNAISVSQWGSQYILIVAPQTNGYFLWDGALFYKAGNVSPQPVIQSGGFGYTSSPTILPVGGTGTSVSIVSQVLNGAITTLSVSSNNGVGYTVSDVLILAFSGGGAAGSTAYGSVALSGGSVTSVSITSAGTGYTSTATVNFLGGDGFGAKGTPVISAGTVASVSVTAGGFGYTRSPTLQVADVNNPVAQAILPVMPFGVQGTQLETYQTRVWISNGSAPSTPPPKSRVLFTAPGSPIDFSTADGAGAFISTDSFLKVGYHGLKQCNGFLYLVGDSSMNYISSVQTSGSPPLTTFSNQNVDPQLGSPWPNTIQVFSRNIVMANTFGVHVSYGGAVTKVSDPLDGVYTSVAPTGEQPSYNGLIPSSAVAVIFGIHVYMLLLPAKAYNPSSGKYDGAQANRLFCWDGKRWWTALPSVTLTQIASQEINSVLTAYGTDGTKIYPLFQKPSTGITKTLVSKLWDRPGYFITKVSRELFGVAFFYNIAGEAIQVSIDNGVASSTAVSLTSPGQLLWFNNAGQQISWTNNSGGAINWLIPGNVVFGPVGVVQPGPLIGVTLTTMAADMALVSLCVIEQDYQTNV